MRPFEALIRFAADRPESRADRCAARQTRDYASLRTNYFAMHGEPMPGHLQREILALQHDAEARHGS